MVDHTHGHSFRRSIFLSDFSGAHFGVSANGRPSTETLERMPPIVKSRNEVCSELTQEATAVRHLWIGLMLQIVPKNVGGHSDNRSLKKAVLIISTA